jgi:S-adenosylmethionine hydrolase
VLPRDAEFVADRAEGVVIALDRYGNAVTNIRPAAGLAVIAPERFAGPVRRAYGEVEVGAAVALVGSSGRIELGVWVGKRGLGAGERVVVSRTFAR